MQTEYVIQKVPEYLLMTYDVPPFQKYNGLYTGRSCMNAYAASSVIIEKMNEDKRAIVELQRER